MFRRITRKLIKFFVKYEMKQRNYALGFNSWIDKNKDEHILFLDYDTQDFSYVLNDCNELAKFWGLSDFEIYRTKKGHHCFFWYDNSLPYSRLQMIINYSRCDVMFKYIRRYYNYATIRCAGKYKENDIFFCGKYTGSRPPTPDERTIGNLKKKEYEILKSKRLFTDEVLKDA
jgi:hypothetical protein